ncbi:hypothetical protein GOV14_03135 [Candidatus Pacearchaeota archaeon]|nr:hypothetical protein [Candidatus Pacearchaeota archaeon]
MIQENFNESQNFVNKSFEKKLKPWMIILIILGIFFLMILVILIGLGIYTYFYLAGTDHEANPKGSISEPFFLESFDIESDGIFLGLKNIGEDKVYISNVQISQCGVTSDLGHMDPEDIKNVRVNCSLDLNAKFLGVISVTYTGDGGAIPLTSLGQISRSVK